MFRKVGGTSLTLGIFPTYSHDMLIMFIKVGRKSSVYRLCRHSCHLYCFGMKQCKETKEIPIPGSNLIEMINCVLEVPLIDPTVHVV